MRPLPLFGCTLGLVMAFLVAPVFVSAQTTIYDVEPITSRSNTAPGMKFDLSSGCSVVPDVRISSVGVHLGAMTSADYRIEVIGRDGSGGGFPVYASTTQFTAAAAGLYTNEFPTPVSLKDACDYFVGLGFGHDMVISVARTTGGSLSYFTATAPATGSAAFAGTQVWHGSGTISTDNISMKFSGTYGAIDWDAITVAPDIDFGQINFVATSSGLFTDNTEALEDIADRCDDSANLFARGMCVALVFTFVPKPTVLNSFTELPNLARSKFPFSWAVGVQESFTGESDTIAAIATSTFQIPFNGAIATSSFGSLIPDITVFSEGTVKHFFTPTTWSAIQALMVATMWLTLTWDIYATVRRRHSHV